MKVLHSSEHLELLIYDQAIPYNIVEDEPDKGLQTIQVFNVHWKEEHKPCGRKESKIGRFALAPMPGCCGIVVSTGLWLEKEYRSTHISKEFMELKEWAPEYLGYSAVIATIDITNIAELKSSAKRNYKIIGNWRNDRSGNNLAIIFKKTNL